VLSELIQGKLKNWIWFDLIFNSLFKMHNYVIQKIQWWLWNQMFQYAFVKALSLRNNIDFKLDITSYEKYFRPYELEIFDIDRNYAGETEIPFYEKIGDWIIKWCLIRLNCTHHCESVSYKHPLKFDSKNLFIKKWYISWSFMSELYFKDQWESIKKDFQFIKPISHKTDDIEKMIRRSNSVSVHIRRWDYLKHADVYPELWRDYYLQAVELIKRKIENPFFVFFSDDIEYARQSFEFLNDVLFVSHNRWNDSWQDMYLMSKCKHNITAHSTFSWRGGYLNDNEKKVVITPREWFVKSSKYYENDIIPKSWLVI